MAWAYSRSRGPAGVWTAAATAKIAGDASAATLVPIELAAGGELGCSVVSGVQRNQFTHTSWSCLTYRKVNGVELVAGSWRVNGKPVAEVLARAGCMAVLLLHYK
jgi:aminoglycoside phosphotransferase